MPHAVATLTEHRRYCHADSAITSLSASAADDKTRLVRSELLQEGASDVQPPSTSGSEASVLSSNIVQGQGAPEPKAAAPAPAEASDPAPAKGADSIPAQPSSTQPSTLPSTSAPPKDFSKVLSRAPEAVVM